MPATLAYIVTVLLAAIATGQNSAPADSGKPPAFTEVCFDDFDLGDRYSTADDVKKLLKPVRGRVSDYRFKNYHLSQLSGLFRIVPTWQPDTALRLATHEPKTLRLHFWKGQQGVTLVYYKSKGQLWAAYGTMRDGDKPTPKTYALWATDSGRYERSIGGTVAVRCQGEHLVLTRGDLVLLCAPFRGAPDEVYLESESAKVIGLEMIRSGPVPLPAVSRTVVRRIDRPAEVDWKTDLWEESKLNKLPDGGIELRVEKIDRKEFYQRRKGRNDPNAPVSQAGIEFDKTELLEFIFELDEPDPGTGIYLADQQGRHLQWVAFYGDRSSDKAVFGVSKPRNYIGERSHYHDRNMVPFAGKRQWIRIVAAAGIMRYWTSGDGVHWSLTTFEDTAIRESFSQIGIYCFPDERKARSIGLKSLVIRRLDGLESLVPEAVKRRVDSIQRVNRCHEWEQHVAESRPGDVPGKVWRRACILRTLAENLPREVCQPLLCELMRDVAAEPGDAAEKFQRLDEASLLTPSNYDGRYSRQDPLGSVYERVGRQLRRQGHPAPFTVTSQALLNRPGWSTANPFPTDLLRHEVLALVQAKQWAEVDTLCRRAKFWMHLPLDASRYRRESHWRKELPRSSDQAAVVHFLEWGQANARVRLVKLADGNRPSLGKQWQHPLIAEIGKESYNILSEFNASLSSGAFRDACGILAAAATADSGELSPDAKDKQLLVSMPEIVRLAMHDNPALRRTMQEEFGPRGRLRVGQAIAENDPAAVEAATLQFLGTEAAGTAHRWLGDRALSGGKFGQALGHYRHALSSVPDTQRSGLLARLRLAGAMLNRDVGEPIDERVTIGEVTLSPGEFETLVERARRATRGGDADRSSGSNGTMATLAPCPPPREYELREWARFDVNMDRRGFRVPYEALWAARSTAVDITAEKMIVNRQFQQVAFDLKSGRRLWQQHQEYRGKQPLRWSVSPLQPVVDRDRIFLRRSAEGGFELACLSIRDGKVLWNNRPPTDTELHKRSNFHGATSVISDPILAGRNLVALTATDEPGDQCAVELALFDGDTGRILRRAPLARFHDRWPGELSAQAVIVGDKIVATVGGAVLCCDLLGRVRWIRRQLWVPPPGEPYGTLPWLKQVHRKPVVADGYVYATQPGVWGIERIDLETGRLFWRTGMPELTSLIGQLGETLIVETTDGLLAMEPHFSSVVWRHPIEDRLQTRLCGNATALCYTRLETSSDQKKQVVLVWIDPKTGRVKDETPLDLSEKVKNPFFGPLAVDGDRQWIFLSTNERRTNQEIMELKVR